ncbi:MAG: hypothetical protein PHG26_05615 [Dehalococcoidales bacterium]|nr:hypothetical protein [Dehalococcoidales bacterium]MDD4794170.1 hypothetical protein [Dehalococcoidales bacterium]MDD5122187.1 hypothetical protein [Dehalococcoidales bacterium]MDD5499041.1 hypothetical protein [Dehalococcoidales bacterium]
MKPGQNITDTLKATIAVVAVVFVAVAGIQLYVALTTDTERGIYNFLEFASDLHDDIDAEFFEVNVKKLAATISAPNLEDSEAVALEISHGVFMTNAYRERFFDLMSVTDETLELKNDLLKEGGSFLTSYNHLREALNNSIKADLNSRDTSLQKALAKIEEAVSLRSQNATRIKQWLAEMELKD